MTDFICPVCGKPLKQNEKAFVCENGHLFDIAKKGYVNLLMSNSSKQHGDTKQMLKARERFLSAGYYKPLSDKIYGMCLNLHGETHTVLDCGCGEGYYTESAKNALPNADIFAIDVSKDALILAKKRISKLRCAVASSFALPLDDDSMDLVLNIFSPLAGEEFLRVVKKGGYWVRIIPLENHLWELKQAVYERPYKNEVKSPNIAGFSLQNSEKLEYKISADNETLQNLFTMTPYFIKTSEKDKQKLADIKELDITVQFGILLYKKI